MSEILTVHVRDEPDAAVVVAKGEIDLTNAQELVKAIDLAAVRRGRIGIDLSECTFFDSTCIGILVRAAREHGNGEPLAVLVTKAGHRLLKIAGLTDQPILDIREAGG